MSVQRTATARLLKAIITTRSPHLIPSSSRAANTTPLRTTSPRAAITTRSFSNTRARSYAPNKNKSEPAHAGAFARTDDSITVQYPGRGELPSSEPIVGGAGGRRHPSTLALFSLEGRVCVVTGGARGLGLVMGQGMVVSGADLAIVDINSMLTTFSFCFG